MNFLLPIAFLFIAVLPLIVLMYLLKLKRKKTDVPSTILWRKSIHDLIANTPFQKLRNNLLLYLQLLAISLLILALARPLVNLSTFKGKTFILLLDNSASMQVKEDIGTRLDLAKKEVIKLINDLRKNDKMMLITFSNKTEIAKGFTEDKIALRSALKEITSDDTTTNIREALLIANSIIKTAESAEVIIISDGAFPSPIIPVKITNLRFVKIGKSQDNIGITDLSVREGFDNPMEYEIFVSLTNYGGEVASTLVDLSLENNLLDSKRVSIPPQKTRPVIFKTSSQEQGRFVLSIDKKDSFALDDRVFGVISPPRKISVLLVSNGNPFLEKGLLLNAKVDVSKISPKDYSDSSKYDLTIFDNFTPKEVGNGNFIFISAVPQELGITVNKEKIESPMIVDWDHSHPMFRFVNLEKVNIAKALSLNLPKSGVKSLAESETSPLIVFYEDLDKKILIIGFDIYDTDFPLQVSYPIFLLNTINWLGTGGVSGVYGRGGAGAAGGGTSRGASGNTGDLGTNIFRSGENVPIAQLEGSENVKLTTPEGKSFQFDFQRDKQKIFSNTSKVGFYKVSPSGILGGDKTKEKYFAVNLLSTEESEVQPRENITVSNIQVKGISSIKRENREIWKWFAWIGLLILCIEWTIYCRRTWA